MMILQCQHQVLSLAQHWLSDYYKCTLYMFDLSMSSIALLRTCLVFIIYFSSLNVECIDLLFIYIHACLLVKTNKKNILLLLLCKPKPTQYLIYTISQNTYHSAIVSLFI